MSVALQPAVGLLERAVNYTRLALAHVTPGTLHNPTPCRAWDLGQLLTHMDDALDAFTQASAGAVDLTTTRANGDILDRIRTKACGLLGAWSEADPRAVEIGDQRMSADVVVCAGALEITVHGWDVGQATGHPSPIPEDLARLLLPIAEELVTSEDRPGRSSGVGGKTSASTCRPPCLREQGPSRSRCGLPMRLASASRAH